MRLTYHTSITKISPQPLQVTVFILHTILGG